MEGMIIKFDRFLVLSLLFFALTSCGKSEMEETLTERVATVDQAKANNLLFAETFESKVPFYTVHGTDFATPYSFQVVLYPVFSGTKSARFELRDTDPMISSGTRSEVTIVKDSIKKEMWYSFAVFFPSDDFAIDSGEELISQWHQAPDSHMGEISQSPATHLDIKNDRFILDTGFNGEQISQGVNQESRRKIDLGLVTKDTWHQFVIHFIHSYEADGLIEIWHNGNKILTHPGGNMYNNVDMPRWKLGIYKWKWNGSETTDTRKRVLYFDNIKVGDNQVSLKDMAPHNNPPSVKDPTPYPITSLTFVNSHTDQDIKRITEGDTLRFSDLGTKKISVRAKTNSAKTGSVKFALRGKKKYTYTDKLMPYTLFGDDGNGNYYYGELPAGNYTLEVTPYSDTKANGVSGEPYTISFTITK
jgi:hypothetical protein